jgi:hypothetical protein
MTANPTIPIVYGTVNGSPIAGACNSGTLAKTQSVTLGATAYVRSVPAGYPRPDEGAPVSSSLYAFPQTIAGGTRITVFSDEAAALIAAGAAT